MKFVTDADRGNVGFEIRDDALFLKMDIWYARNVVQHIQKYIRYLAHKEFCLPSDFQQIHSLSRLGYELVNKGTMSRMNAAETVLLARVFPNEIEISWFEEIRRNHGHDIKHVEIMNPDDADYVVRSVGIVMST